MRILPSTRGGALRLIVVLAVLLLGLLAYWLWTPGVRITDVGYHHPDVENLSNALAGVRAALAEHKTLPPAYRGVAIYSAWTMSDADWRELREAFCADSLAPRGAE